MSLTKSVTLEPGQSQPVSFHYTPPAAGTYSVVVNGLSGSFSTKAEVGRIYGYVYGDSLPLSGATVIINGYTDVTDYKGAFEFRDLPFGDYVMRAAAEGYRSYNIPIKLRSESMGLEITLRAVAPPAYTPIQVVDLDSDNNEVVGGEDEAAFLQAHPSIKGDPSYDRQFDANFDGVIDNKDYDCFYQTLGKDLNAIRSSIKTGIHEHLVWPDGWDAYMVALNKDKVEEFTGHALEEGWISVRHHPYVKPGYHCWMFGAETALAAYKALGYGCLLTAMEATVGRHCYNIFWMGGDWHDLNNWYIVEPQSGRLIGSAGREDLPDMYHTVWIQFWDYVGPGLEVPGARSIYYHYLHVDYEAKIVTFGVATDYYFSFELYPVHGRGLEDQLPDLFDRAFMI